MNSWSVPQKYPEGQKPRNPQFVLGQNWKQILREPHETNAFKKGLIQYRGSGHEISLNLN